MILGRQRFRSTEKALTSRDVGQRLRAFSCKMNKVWGSNYSMAIIVNNTVYYTCSLLRE